MKTLNAIEPWSDDNGNEITGLAAGKVVVNIRGKGCRIQCGEGSSINGLIHLDCDGATLIIGNGVRFTGSIRIGLRSTVKIGDKTTSTQSTFLSAAEGATLAIGRDCMFATHNQIRCDDAHPIYCRGTGKRLNASADITIGDHVWLAYDALVTGGSAIGDGSIIGQRSIVMGDLPKNCLAVGTPARVVRENVEWSRSHLTLSAPFSFPDKEPPP